MGLLLISSGCIFSFLCLGLSERWEQKCAGLLGVYCYRGYWDLLFSLGLSLVATDSALTSYCSDVEIYRLAGLLDW